MSAQIQRPAKPKLGLKVLVNPGNPNVDIVAVHGLGANPDKSWYYENTGSESFNWVTHKKGIQAEYDNARIMQYAYGSAYQGRFKMKQYISILSSGLLDELSEERKDCSRRSLVFIGHSMGGIVIAKAFCLADRERIKYPDMYESFAGCLFFGTPFEGAPVAAVAMEWAKKNEVLNKAITSQLLTLLMPENESLRELKREFVRSVGKLKEKVKLHCFYEEEQTNWDAIVSKLANEDFPPEMLSKLDSKESREFVSKDSAVLDDADETGIYRTHRDLVKFESPKDPQYQRVRGPLRRIVQSAPRVARARFNCTRQRDIDPETYRKVLDELDGIDMRRVYKKLQQRLTSESWLLQDSLYQGWARQRRPVSEGEDPNSITEGSGTSDLYLWIHGPEGKGKTTAWVSSIRSIEQMIKHAEELGSTSRPDLIAYFSCDQTSDCSNAEDMLKSLLEQLCQQQESLASYAASFVTSAKGSTRTAHLSVEHLWQCLRDMLTDGSVGTIYFIINNLHELEERSDSTGKFLRFIKSDIQGETQEKGKRVSTRWLFTSRDRDLLREHLPASPKLCCIDIKDEKYGKSLRTELEKHAWARVDVLQKEKGYSKAITYFAGSVIGHRAEDSKWIDMAVARLQALPSDTKDGRIRRMLEHVPENFKTLLDEMWESILVPNTDDIDSIKELLRALILARRDPTESELLVLIGLSPTDEEDIKHLGSMVDKCKPLVKQFGNGDKVTIGFVSADVKKHLDENSEALVGLSEHHRRLQHGLLALRCFSHVLDSFSTVQEDEPEPQGNVTQVQAEMEPSELELKMEGLNLTDGETASSEVPREANKEVDNHEKSNKETDEKKVDVERSGNEELGNEKLDDVQNEDEETKGDESNHQIDNDEDDDSEESSEDDNDSDWDEQPADQIKYLSLPYATQYWLEHARRATQNVAQRLCLEETFWRPRSEVRAKWLIEYEDHTDAFKEAYVSSKGLTALHVASSVGFPLLVQSLLDMGHKAELHEYDTFMNQPLHLAATFGQSDIIEQLITAKAKVDDAGPDGTDSTPLSMAASSGQVDAIRILLSKGANKDAISAYFGPVINAAILSGNRDAVMMFVNEEVKLSFQDDEVDWPTPLALAARYSDISIFSSLLEAVGTSLTANEHEKALWAVSVSGRIEVAEKLLEYKHGHEVFETCLEMAMDEHNWDVARLLLDHAQGLDVDCLYTFKAAAKDSESLEDILDKCWELSGKSLPQDILDDCLYTATDMEKEDTVKKLLEFKANPNARGEEFGNALTAAANDGTLSIVTKLIDAGAAVDAPEGYALQIAAMQGHLDVVKLLLKHGAFIDRACESGTALQAACDNGHLGVVNVLLENGADPNKGGGDFERPIIAPIVQNNTDILHRLLQSERLELDFWDGPDSWTPLHYAAFHLPAGDVKELLEKGAPVDLGDSDGDTALMAAVGVGDAEVVKILLEQGADILIRSKKEGLTALDIAAQLGKKECVNLLAARASVILHAVKVAADEQNEEAIRFIEFERQGRSHSMAQGPVKVFEDPDELIRFYDLRSGGHQAEPQSNQVSQDDQADTRSNQASQDDMDDE